MTLVNALARAWFPEDFARMRDEVGPTVLSQ
jgi:hypothetical protein